MCSYCNECSKCCDKCLDFGPVDWKKQFLISCHLDPYGEESKLIRKVSIVQDCCGNLLYQVIYNDDGIGYRVLVLNEQENNNG